VTNDIVPICHEPHGTHVGLPHFHLLALLDAMERVPEWPKYVAEGGWPATPVADQVVKFDHELLYQRTNTGIIRFRNTIKTSDEMREVIVGLFLGFSDEKMRQDIIDELMYYKARPDQAGQVAKAISGGLQKGEKMS
jgi:hypothetical protein